MRALLEPRRAGRYSGTMAKRSRRGAADVPQEIDGPNEARNGGYRLPRETAPTPRKGTRRTPEEALKEKLQRDRERDKGYRKAAEFLMLLGQEDASKVLTHLSEEEVTGIMREIAQIQRIDADQAHRILEEFGYLMKTRDLVARGGIEAARSILLSTFGAEKGEEILARIRERTIPHPFAFLMDLEFEQLLLLLKDESPPVLAMILPHLDPAVAARVVGSLPRDTQVFIARRIAGIEKIDPEVLRRAEETLREKIRLQGTIVTQEIDGKAALANILSHMDLSREEELIESLERQDGTLAEDIRKRLFSIDVVLRLRDIELQAVLRDYADQELTLLLKGVPAEVKEKLLANVSSRRREIILSELSYLGPVRRSEIDKAIGEFLDYLRGEAEQGNLTLARGDDELVE
jgi:flagellar motor switch protein FliG